MSYGRQPRHVVVVGSGISGLTAAYLVGQAGRGAVRVTVVEKGPVVGGHLRVAEVAGLPSTRVPNRCSTDDRRPSNWPVRPGSATTWNTVTAAGLWSRGVVVLPATTLLGVPSVPADLAQILDPDDVARVAAEPTVPGSPLLDDDVAVGTVVSARMGQAVTQRLVDPFGGVYAGRADECRFGRRCPTCRCAVARGFPAASRGIGAEGRRFRRPGVRRHSRRRRPAACGCAAVSARDRTGTTWFEELSSVRAARGGGGRRRGRGLAGRDRPCAPPEFLDADAVIVAVPATPAARMLADVAPAAAAGSPQWSTRVSPSSPWRCL